MRAILLSALGVIAGFVVASGVMMAAETTNSHLFYPELAQQAAARDAEVVREFSSTHPQETPAGDRELALRRREAVREMLAGAPAGALLVVGAGWIVGSLAGGFVTAKIGRRTPLRDGLILGGLLTLAGIANNLMLPPPVWFWVLTFLVLLPSSYAGARLGARRGRKAPSIDSAEARRVS